jgi:hypothetical protein
MKVVVPNAVPVVGGMLDRFSVRQYATNLVSGSLDAIRAWCERRPSDPARPGSTS